VALDWLTVAAMLPANWEPWLVDLNTQSLSDEDVASADIACVSARFATAPNRNVPYIDLCQTCIL
jgi:hypothetical protein